MYIHTTTKHRTWFPSAQVHPPLPTHQNSVTHRQPAPPPGRTQVSPRSNPNPTPPHRPISLLGALKQKPKHNTVAPRTPHPKTGQERSALRALVPGIPGAVRGAVPEPGRARRGARGPEVGGVGPRGRGGPQRGHGGVPGGVHVHCGRGVAARRRG